MKTKMGPDWYQGIYHEIYVVQKHNNSNNQPTKQICNNHYNLFEICFQLI